MSLSRQTPEQSLETGSTPDQSSLSQSVLGSLPMYGLLGNAATASMLGLGPMGAAMAGAGAAAAAFASAGTPQKEYVDMSRGEKTDSLVGLMNDSRGILDANGVSEHMESKMAAIMQNEGSRNLRRKSMGDIFTKQATGLQGALKGVDLEALKADPEKMKKFTAGLSEDQQFLFEQVKSGSLNLDNLNSKDKATKDATRDQLTELGIQKRSDQYQEMTDLMKKQADGTKLSKEESARLTTLNGMTGLGMGKTTMGSLSGMSKDRFAEIYREGQERFEPAQYKQLKASYEKGLKAQTDPEKDIKISAGIGSFNMNKDDQSSLATNMDLIADMSTSYGISQVMGAYAHAGLLKSKDAEGNDHTVTLEEMKASGQRLTPTSEDVQQQLAFFQMKGIDASSKDLSDDSITRKYNGSKPGSDLYTQYTNGLATGAPAYDAAKKKAADAS